MNKRNPNQPSSETVNGRPQTRKSTNPIGNFENDPKMEYTNK